MPTMAPDRLPTESVDDVLGLDDEKFKALVETEMRGRGRTDDEDLARLTALMSSDARIVERWFHELRQMHRSVENQLAAKDADWQATEASLKRQKGKRNEFLSEKERYARSRASSIRFKTGVEQRLLYVRRLRDGSVRYLLETALVDENLGLVRRVRELEAAIRRHRDEFPDDERPSQDDKDLWELVADLPPFDPADPE